MGFVVGLIVGFTINEFLRTNQRNLSKKDSKTDERENHHNVQLRTDIIDISTSPTERIHQLQEEFDLLTMNPLIKLEKYKEILQVNENLLNEKIHEYKKLKYEILNKEEEIKSEIDYLDDFTENLKLFIQQEEAILVNGSNEDTLTLMNILLIN
ncbi:4824_t:CDS:1 [Funneliformis mosseae]|uniref:4824_t:CDS:1 n=1 Tax=Funneliformis mosseae TaxID=27381 RepID=A0A9N9DHM5_FUNMO|nr:4824_t:CDS:1 [Funneliformis mosseae]